MKNKLTVKIQRKSYNFISDESQEYTDMLAGLLERRINDCIKKNEGISSLDAAYLTAFDCMDELVKANKNIDNIRTQIKDYVDDSTRSKASEDKLRSELEDAQRKISLLREKYAELYNEYKHLKSALRNTGGENKASDESAKKKSEPAPKQGNQPSKNHNNGSFVGMRNYDPQNGGQH